MIKFIKKLKIVLLKELILLLTFIIILSLLFISVFADPIGPTITVLSNTTKNATPSTKINTTINGTISPGSYIFVLSMDSRQKNTRWKAYVGNVTGTLALDDANDNTLYQWSLTSIIGEVYATRASGNVNWSGINCTWRGEGVTGYNESNRTIEELENAALSHSFINDNITSTFANANHSSITVAGKIIGKDECFAVQTWQRNRQQVFSDSDNANFTQVILYDGTNTTNGNIVYVTEIEDDITGYRTDSTYDFQMLVPENGLPGFSGSTAYYFYVELT